MTKLGKTIISVIVVAMVAVVIWLASPLYMPKPQAPVVVATVEPTPTPTPTPTPDLEAEAFAKEYEENKVINSEYIGKLKFESLLVEQNLVQTTDNDKYLNVAWDTTVDNEGAAFMDYRNTLSDQNLIVYGHYVYYDDSAMFTPLQNLLDSENYEANKYIDVYFSGTDIRRYMITDVYYYPMYSDTLKYYVCNYDAESFNMYYQAVKEADLYDTGESITMDDHLLSIQTCVRDHDELREIVVAKQVERK